MVEKRWSKRDGQVVGNFVYVIESLDGKKLRWENCAFIKVPSDSVFSISDEYPPRSLMAYHMKDSPRDWIQLKILESIDIHNRRVKVRTLLSRMPFHLYLCDIAFHKPKIIEIKSDDKKEDRDVLCDGG